MSVFARPPVRTPGALAMLNLLAFASYAVVGALTLLLGQYSGLASPVWPAAGIAFAMAYAWGWRVLPGVALGSLAANAVTLARLDSITGESITVTVVIGLGAALQAAVGAILVGRAIGFRASLTRGGQILAWFVSHSRSSPETEILSGELVLDEASCIRLEGYLLILPPETYLREDPLRIVDHELHELARIGDLIQVTGAEKGPDDYRYFENKVHCPGPYWGVNQISAAK